MQRRKEQDKASDTVNVTVRLPQSLVEKLDGRVDGLNRSAVGPQWTRTDAMRVAITQWLEDEARTAEAVADER